MPRQDVLVPGPLEDSYHGLKTSCAALPRAGVTTMRLSRTFSPADNRRQATASESSIGYVGLVFLFSTATGEILAIFPDGFMQAIRVGVTNALSAKYLARKDSSVMALYGSGWKAVQIMTWVDRIAQSTRDFNADDIGGEKRRSGGSPTLS
jgi:ornithine cyclodeaminase/alanine dehydrogenase-like protein (mu-crystallin family)